MFKNIRLYIIIVLGATLLSGCSPASQPEGTGVLELMITDAPAQIDSLNVTISSVMVHKAVNETFGNESENETLGSDGWFEVLNGSRTYDLIELRNVSEFLGSRELDTGRYTQIRLEIDDAQLSIDGNIEDLDVPSGEIKLIRGFTIEENQTTSLTLDFDANESVVETGNNRFLLRPTIRILEE